MLHRGQFSKYVTIAGAFLFVLAATGCATGAKKPPADPVAAHIKELESHAASASGDARAQYELGNAYFDARRFVEARGAYLRATEIDPKFADAFTNLGLVYRVEGNLAASVAQYEKALVIAPEDTITRQNLIVALQAAKQPGAAADQLAELSRRLPEDMAVVKQLAEATRQLGRIEEAEAAYTRFVAKRPADADAWFALGEIQRKRGRRDQAIASWKQATAQNADHAKAHAALAEAYAETGDYDRAWLSVRETQRVGGYLDPKMISRLQELSGRTGPE